MTAPEQNTRVALVTGGGQGIGRGIATRLLEEGYEVHVNVRNESKRVALSEAAGELRLHAGDLSRPGAGSALVGSVVERAGRLDALVHAVGPYTTSRVSETSAATYREMFEGNLMTSVEMVDAARVELRRSRGAMLFFGCAGLDRWRARNVTTAYIAAKSALLCYVRGLALEEAKHGVRANMISPGFVPHEGAAPDTISPELHVEIPLGRPAEMAEITDVAAFLLSGAASHVVGQNLEVAGGWML